jgi:hypothetical protein
MSRSQAVAYAIGLPIMLLVLIFLPAGSLRWRPGWVFVIVLALAFGTSAVVIARVNPIIYRRAAASSQGRKAGTRRCSRSCCRRWWRSCRSPRSTPGGSTGRRCRLAW